MNLSFAGIDSVEEVNGQLKIKTGDNEFMADKILMTAGRRPNLDKLNLEAAGIKLDSKGLPDFCLETFKIKGRAELVNYDKEESPFETGYLLYQDVAFKPKSNPFSFTFRYAIFDTKSYNSRIYAYENDVLYSFSIPAYYNRGTRTYLTVKYKIRRGIDFWLRYAITYYDNVDVISSGLEEIQGNHKQEIKAQVRFKF